MLRRGTINQTARCAKQCLKCFLLSDHVHNVTARVARRWGDSSFKQRHFL